MIEIRKSREKDLPELARMYKSVFRLHNVFSRREKDVMDYLKKMHTKFAIIVASHDDEIAGGCVVVVKSETKEHKLSQIKHVAVVKEYQGKGVGKELMKKAEDIIARGKVEVHVAESEDFAVDFYKKLGYEIEGGLKSHYRKGETCFILGKVLE
ncbi:GNAT family N-acetyltransferase [Candidatus Woesearchaeota archaeon]|nr:GNAT family N-acetyltransferase [Candidatus Woesearchaeota archaeon]